MAEQVPFCISSQCPHCGRMHVVIDTVAENDNNVTEIECGNCHQTTSYILSIFSGAMDEDVRQKSKEE